VSEVSTNTVELPTRQLLLLLISGSHVGT